MFESVEGDSTIIGPRLIAWAVTVAISPLVIALLFVLSSSLLIGLPLTAILSKNNKESVIIYAVIGSIFGTAIVLAFLVFTDLFFAFGFSLLGTLGGAVTGRVWAISRVSSWNRF